MTSRNLRSALVVICLLVLTAQARAEVVLLSQSRSVSYAFWQAEGNSILAPDFGLFEESIETSWADWFCCSSYWLSATQNSEIQAGHISIHGDTDGGTNEMWSYDFAGSAYSDFEVLFEVTVPTPFTLIGSLVAGGYSVDSDAGFQLDWNGTPYLSFSSGDNHEEIMVSENGILAPGAYILTVNASTIVLGDFSSGGSSSFNFDLFLETPVAVAEMSWGRIKAMYR